MRRGLSKKCSDLQNKLEVARACVEVSRQRGYAQSVPRAHGVLQWAGLCVTYTPDVEYAGAGWPLRYSVWVSAWPWRWHKQIKGLRIHVPSPQAWLVPLLSALESLNHLCGPHSSRRPCHIVTS